MIAGGGAVAGIGFTVSLLISSIAFDGQQLEEAKLGVLAVGVLASLLGWVVFRVIRRLPAQVRARQIAGTADELSTSPTTSTPSATTSADRRGRAGHARRVRRLRVPVLRPGGGRHPRAARVVRRRRCATSGATCRSTTSTRTRRRPPRRPRRRPRRAPSGRCTTCCSSTRTSSTPRDLRRYAEELGLDVERFCDDLRRREHAAAHRGGRRERGRERRRRHADVLHQRQAPPAAPTTSRR